MGRTLYDTRQFELESRPGELQEYLEEIERLALSQLAEEDPEATKERRDDWKGIFKAWTKEMKQALGDCMEQDRIWRRVIFLMEEYKHMIGREQPVLNRSGTAVAFSFSARIVKSTVQAESHQRIPHWVDDERHSLPVSLTYRRLTALTDRLEKMRDEMNASRRAGYGWSKLNRWVVGVEDVMIYHVQKDEEWEKIMFMLDDMKRRFDEKESLLDCSGQIAIYFTGRGFLKSLNEPWSLRFKDFQPKSRPVRRGRMALSIGESRRTSSRLASRYEVVTRGSSHEGGLHF